MPIPSSIADLSTTASLNSPAGSDSPTEGDNYIRALSAILKTADNDRIALEASLAASGTSADGAGMIGFNPSVSYSQDTAGRAFLEGVPSLMWFVTDETERAAIKAGTSTTDYSSTITTALAICGKLFIPNGTFNCSSDVSLADSQQIIGAGYNAKSKLKFASGKGLILPSASARNEVRDLHIEGTSKTGIGIKIGDTDFTGQHVIRRVRVSGFATGVELKGALWTTLEECYIHANTLGIDFNAGGASKYSTTVEINRCRISDNDLEGIGATYTPVRNQTISVRGGSVENNCVTDRALAQMKFGSSQNVVIDNVYVEATFGSGGLPIGLDLSDAAHYNVFAYFNGASTGIYTGTAATGPGEIHDCRFVGITSKDYDINGSSNANGVHIKRCEYSGGSRTLSGVDCYDYGNDPQAPWPSDEVAWTPTLRGSSTAGTPTYTSQVGRYTDIGKRRFIEARISITAIGGMTGNLQIGGLPGARASTPGMGSQMVVQYDGITFSAGRTELVAEIASGGSVIDLYQCGSGVATLALPISGVAASTTVIVSGSYPIT